MIRVFVVKGPEQGRAIVFNGNTAEIGRGLANDVCLNDGSVSRKHAKIYWDKDRYYVEDLQSKNGTRIDGNVIKSGQRVQVEEGVPIAVGDVLVSLGKKCSPNQLPNPCSIKAQAPGDDGMKPSTSTDRRSTQKKELELIYEISVGLLESLDLPELGAKVLASIFGCLKRIDSGFIFLVEPDSGKLKKIAGRLREGHRIKRPGYSRNLVSRVVKEGKAVMMPNTAMENKADISDSMERIGVKSVICVPLVSKKGIRGAMYLQSVNVVEGFRKNDLLFLTGLGTPIALAMENALLYGRSKRAERRLRKASDHLEKEVMNRTAELKKAKDELEQLSITDGLSGLYNYRYLIHSIELELGRSIRYNRAIALLLMDIDYLKNLNDTYGHLCGDYVIKTVAKILRSNVRSTDVVARYGGDELAVMLVETDAERALEAAEKLSHAIGTHTFQWQTRQLSVSISIGLTTAPAPRIKDASDLVNAADLALYQAKNAGRNTIVVFGQEEKAAASVQKVLPFPKFQQ